VATGTGVMPVYILHI